MVQDVAAVDDPRVGHDPGDGMRVQRPELGPFGQMENQVRALGGVEGVAA